MGSLGMPEILIILVIALIVFGPRKLPELGKTLGQSLAQFRRASEDFKRQWEDEVAVERQRIEAPPPAPVEYASDPAPESTSVEQVHASAPVEYASDPAPESTSVEQVHASAPVEYASDPAPESTSVEQVHASAPVEPSQIPTASETPVTAHHEETAAQETKHDWM